MSAAQQPAMLLMWNVVSSNRNQPTLDKSWHKVRKRSIKRLQLPTSPSGNSFVLNERIQGLLHDIIS